MVTPVIFRDEVDARIRASGIIAVVILDRLENAVPLARALLDGGIDIIELTLRTPAALPAMALLHKEVPAMMVGAGTVLTPADLKSVIDAGAAFGVSPGVNRNVLEAAGRAKFSFAPGVSTATDIESALEHGCRMLKFFPAEQMGGLPYFNAISAPYDHLGLSYIPLGGLSDEKIPAYLSRPSIAAVGGSWMAAAPLIAAGDWAKISALSAQSVERVRSLRLKTAA